MFMVEICFSGKIAILRRFSRCVTSSYVNRLLSNLSNREKKKVIVIKIRLRKSSTILNICFTEFSSLLINMYIALLTSKLFLLQTSFKKNLQTSIKIESFLIHYQALLAIRVKKKTCACIMISSSCQVICMIVISFHSSLWQQIAQVIFLY